MPESLVVRSLSRKVGSETAIDEATLVALAVRDPRAFAPLYARYLDSIHRYCYRRLGSREAAEDATSRTFENALKGLHKFRGGSFRAWLFTIAHRVVIDDGRSTRPVKSLEAIAWVLDPAPSPEDRVLTGERLGAVHSLLNILSFDQRQVVELRLSGLSGREIADVLDRSHAWVRTTQMRALARLRTFVADIPEAEGWHDV